VQQGGDQQQLDFWSSSIFARVDTDSLGKGHWTPSNLSDLLGDLSSHVIEGFTEYRYPFGTTRLIPLPPPLGMQHSFVILEIPPVGRAGGFGHGICIERFENSLELMLGELNVIRNVAAGYRANGRSRSIDADRALEETPRVALGGSTGLATTKVSELLAWITGPLASAWQPYDYSLLLCQHFTADLISFLRGEEPEMRVYSLHSRPLPGGL